MDSTKIKTIRNLEMVNKNWRKVFLRNKMGEAKVLDLFVLLEPHLRTLAGYCVDSCTVQCTVSEFTIDGSKFEHREKTGRKAMW